MAVHKALKADPRPLQTIADLTGFAVSTLSLFRRGATTTPSYALMLALVPVVMPGKSVALHDVSAVQ